MKIVIVDDSTMMRGWIKSRLSKYPWINAIQEAATAQEALVMIQALPPDAVIMDIHMPGGNGIELLRQIKRMARPPVVVMLTNFFTPEYREACLAAGAECFLDKSFGLHQLETVLRGFAQQQMGVNDHEPASCD